MKKRLFSFGLFLLTISLFTACSSSSSYYRSGKKFFAKENYEEAAVKFSLAIAENPNRADYYIDYGMTFIALGQYEEAITQFDAAFLDKNSKMINKNNKRILRGKGIAYYHMMQYQKAIDHFEQALQMNELSELDMDILYYKGSSFMLIGSYEEAANAYTELLLLNKKDADALFDRAFIYRNLGEYEKGLADYDLAIELKPNRYPYYFGKYYMLKDMGKTAEADQVLSEAAGIEVKTKEDRYNQAKLQFYLGNYDIALSELSEGIANGFSEALYYIGEIYRVKKDYETAIYYYKEYIRDGEVLNPIAFNQLASCLMKIEDYKSAIHYLEMGIEYQNSSTMKAMKKNEIVAYENLGMFDVAMQKIQEYRISYPEDSMAQRESEFLKTRLYEIE